MLYTSSMYIKITLEWQNPFAYVFNIRNIWSTKLLPILHHHLLRDGSNYKTVPNNWPHHQKRPSIKKLSFNLPKVTLNKWVNNNTVPRGHTLSNAQLHLKVGIKNCICYYKISNAISICFCQSLYGILWYFTCLCTYCENLDKDQNLVCL